MANRPQTVSSDSNAVRRRVLLVGLDGATFDVILPLAEAGRLPVLARLMEKGAWGQLRSTLPPLSPVAWSSFLTGKNPGQHGVYGFEELEPGGYDLRPVAATREGHPSLWRLISGHGRCIVALDIPFSYPPEPVNGCLIAGYGAPVGEGSVFTHPASLRDELARRFGECEVAVPRMKAAPPRDALFRRWDRILDNRRRIADHLVRTLDWDAFMIVLGVTDHIQHAAWTYCEPLHPDYHKPDAARFREALFQFYEKADAFIGRLLDAAGEPIHVAVLSDHGFGTTWRGDLTRRILAEAGLLRYRGLPFGVGVGARLIDALHKTYHRMSWLKRFLHRRPHDRRRLKRAAARAIDWPRTAAFSEAMGMQIYVNEKGKFPLGSVAPGGEYDYVCRTIRDRLESAVAPGTDRRLIRRVWPRDEVYCGRMVSRAPDLLVEYENLHGVEFADDAGHLDLVGSHAMNGILIAAGPEIRAARLSGARIIDVAPTVLHLMNLPVPDDFDGRVLSDAIAPEAIRARPIRSVPATESSRPEEQDRELSPEEADSIREQLRNLGYLD